MAKKKTKKKPTAEARKKPVHLIQVIGERSDYLLEGLTETEYCGLKCLVGKYADRSVSWLYGTKIRFPIDKVTMITEFPSVEIWARRIKKYRDNIHKNE